MPIELRSGAKLPEINIVTPTIPPAIMTTFLLNPYEADLTLSDPSDRKLFTLGCEGLATDSKFNGERSKISDFLKLIGNGLSDICASDVFRISVEFKNSSDPKIPTKITDIFEIGPLDDNTLLKDHVDLVWAESTFDQSPKFFDTFSTPPIDTTTLTKLRNQRKLRHVMAGKKIWNSFTDAFQLEITGDLKTFSRNGHIDGALLFSFFCSYTNPTTVIENSNLKDEIEGAVMKTFDQDVKKFHTWFKDKRKAIIKSEKGDDSYKEYIRCLFKTYKTSSIKAFREPIVQERTKWITGSQSKTYDYTDLTTFA